MKSTKLWVLALLLACSGCASSINYDSQYELERLRALKGETVVLLGFNSGANHLVDSALEAPAAKVVRDQHKDYFTHAFASSFTLKDASQHSLPVDADTNDLAEQVRHKLKELNADGALVVANSYGYTMAAGSIQDGVIESFLKKILPEKLVGPVIGPSQVQSYDFASHTRIFDRDGRVVWSFYGKASALPTFSEMLKPADLARSVIGLDPSAQNLATAITGISKEYCLFLEWMLRQDFEGRSAKNYFIDYPAQQRSRYVSIFPASDKAHVPFVKEYNPINLPQ